MRAEDITVLLPYIILGVGSMALLLVGAFAHKPAPRTPILVGAVIAALALLCAIFFYGEGAPGGGFIVGDGFSRAATIAASAAALVVLLLSVGYTERRPLGMEEYPSLVLFAAFGMSLLASSDSLLGIFLGLECMSLALYVLLASNKADARSAEAGLKYLIIGAISTAFFAYGLALVYAATGTLTASAAMRALVSAGKMDALGLAGWAMLIVGLGFKVSLFPFHLWAPDVYEGGPSPVVAFLSTMSKASVFALFIRLATATGDGWGALVPALWVMAALTMAFGNVAALTQDNVKRLLAYSSIAQMGYVMMAVLAAPYAGAGAAMFYLAAYIAMELGAFGVVGAFSTEEREFGDIRSLRGMGYVYPFRGFVLALCLVSLAGLPPTAGFIGKFGIFYAALKAGFVWLAAIGIVTAIVSVYYYLRVVVYLYMREEERVPLRRMMPVLDPAGRFALGLLAVVVIALGVLPGGLLDYLAGL